MLHDMTPHSGCDCTEPLLWRKPCIISKWSPPLPCHRQIVFLALHGENLVASCEAPASCISSRPLDLLPALGPMASALDSELDCDDELEAICALISLWAFVSLHVFLDLSKTES